MPLPSRPLSLSRSRPLSPSPLRRLTPHSSLLTPLAAACLLGALTAGCSWSRYDDVVEKSPIVLLNRPKDLSDGFGTSLATARVGSEVTLLVGGAPLTSGGAEFDLGTGDSPTLEARDTGHCLGSDVPCYFSSSPVALARAQGPGKEPEALCFVDGAGTASKDTGVVVRCTDDVEYALDIPTVAQNLLTFSINNSQPTPFRFGADHGPDPALLASADEESAVWYYPPLSKKLVDIPNPASSTGKWEKPQMRTLAVARVGADSRLLAVGTPFDGSVRLFFAADGVTPSYVGCLGGTSGFGRAFAAGPVVAGAKDDELVISDDSIVYVFDAAKLSTLVPTAGADCTLGALPAGSLVTSFTCGSTKNISDCDGSEFGAALAVGDLDGDGDGEVVVGAPSMTVRHKSRAGALIIYDVDPPKASTNHLYDFKDIAFLSSADEDDQLGRSIALPDLGDRQLLVAGAPGGGKTALFYCPSFLPAELAGERCK
jgi:FG-GAP repeat